MTNIVLLILHGLCAVLLIGAMTHQAISLFFGHRGPRDRFTRSVRGVRTHTYTNAVVVLFIVTFTIGMYLYPEYRVNVRPLWDIDLPPAVGSFEVKEHFTAVGLAILPVYWLAWHQPEHHAERRVMVARAALTGLLLVVVWLGFLVGHVLNNLHGL